MAASLLAITEEQVIDYFRKKGALSAKTAITLDFEDLKSKLDVPEFVSKDFSEYTFVKITDSGKYFIDEQELKRQTKLVTKIFIVIGVILVIPVVFSVIAYLLSW